LFRLLSFVVVAALRDWLTQQKPSGSVIKFQVDYDAPYWREDGLNRFVISLDDAFNVDFDNSRTTLPAVCCSASSKAPTPALRT